MVRKKGIIWSVVIVAVMSVFLITPWGQTVRWLIVDSVLVTQHRSWADWLGGQSAKQKRVDDLQRRAGQFAEAGTERSMISIANVVQGMPTVEPIRGIGWRGYLLIVPDPRNIRLEVTSHKDRGEKVSEMVARTGAIAGVNAGGFADPGFRGANFYPLGFVIREGQLLYPGTGRSEEQAFVGFDQEGYLMSGKSTVQQLLQRGVRDVVQFSPRLIVNGKGLINQRSDGWGIAPRTVVGQRKDGTVLFAVIDGRTATSLGANLYDVQQMLLQKGAVHAANLDGGASSVLVHQGVVVNHPSSREGERSVPTAFLIYENVPVYREVKPWERQMISKE